MNLYIDCEWDGYRGELLSMALVGDGGSFHVVMIDRQANDPWVKEHVVPHLHKWAPDAANSDAHLSHLLSLYLTDEARPEEPINIVADWPEDIERFCRALVVGPGKRIETPPLTFEIVRVPDGMAVSEYPHNAYADAMAFWEWHREAMK